MCTNSNGKCIHVYLCTKTLQCSCSNHSYYTPLHEMQSFLYAHFGLMATCTLQKRVPNSQEGCINITYGWVQWYSSVRKKLCDPNYAGWFLKFDPKVPKPHVPKCDNNYDPPKCSEFYHDQEQTPGHPHGDGNCVQFPCDCGCVPCGEYLWDHRNQSLRKWLVEVHLTGDTALDNPNIDGIFTDDEWNSPGGPTEVDAQSVEDMGLSSKDVADITANWVLSMKAAHTKVLEKGGFAWRMFAAKRARPLHNSGPPVPPVPRPSLRRMHRLNVRCWWPPPMCIWCHVSNCIALLWAPFPNFAFCECFAHVVQHAILV